MNKFFKQYEGNNNSIINDLQDYMFTSKNMLRYTKHIINFPSNVNKQMKPRQSLKNIDSPNKNIDSPNKNIVSPNKNIDSPNKNMSVIKKKEETMYNPKQKDSLFWCFYILKYGYSNYEMEINNQYFTIEKNEKFKYIELLRNNKDKLKIHKIKPLTELEDDLANKDKISIKTFFALCVIEQINVLLVVKRKVYELLCVNVDITHPIHVIHRNNETYEHFIEIEPSDKVIETYKNTYYKMSNFDSSLKSIGSYKLDELIDLCKKLDINIEEYKKRENKTKVTKKDIYELIVLQ